MLTPNHFARCQESSSRDAVSSLGVGLQAAQIACAHRERERESRYDGAGMERWSLCVMIPIIRIRIDFTDNVNLGPGKIALLEAIKTTGSISDAARALGMSYRRAWMLINSLKEGFSEAVTVSSTGGKGGGGARVTAFGNSLIKQFRLLEREIARLGAQRLTVFVPHVVVKPASSDAVGRRHLAKKILQRSERIP
jgi:molybdate transport system regulatory protein